MSNSLVYSNFVWTKKGVIIDIEIWIIKTHYSLLKSHLAVQICTVGYVEYFVDILFAGDFICQTFYLLERFVQKVVTLNTVASLTVNSAMNIFQQSFNETLITIF